MKTETRVSARLGGFVRRVERSLRRRLDISESDEAIQRDAARYWNGAAEGNLQELAHWRGAGIFEDEQRWLALGEEHLALAERLSRTAPTPLSLDRVIEWGCGGGANAAVFAERCQRFYGVDIAAANLAECERVLVSRGFSGFVPVKVEVEKPEMVMSQVTEACDFFLCTYVFELITSQAYGEQLLRLAQQLLRPGGAALIQIRYADGSQKLAAKRREYLRNAIFFTSYAIHEFWLSAESAGFEPTAIWLVPTRGRAPHTGAPEAYFNLHRR